MVFPNIEKIKQEYTDKYVVVDPQRPELARFADVVGQVKTVNMSGRALVEFLDYHLNIGWYDIELEFLKVVDKPEPKAKEEKKPAAKAEAKKPAEAKAAPAAKPQAGKPSTADILAKLKGGAGAAPAAKKEEAPKPKAEAATATPPAEAGSPGKVDRAKMSVAEMLAAARGGAAAAKSEPKAEAPASKETPAPVPTSEPAPTPPAAEAASPGGIVKVDRSGMSVAEMVAYCREKDAS